MNKNDSYMTYNTYIEKIFAKSKMEELFHGHYVYDDFLENDIVYQLHIIINEDYAYSLLVDDTWAYDKDNRNYDSYLNKVDLYLVHPSIKVNCENLVLDDPEYLYYLPFKHITKVFLSAKTYKKVALPNEVLALFEKPTVRNLRVNDKKKPLLSIITTVFNNAKLLEQAIQSVINQNNPLVEYVIKDAGSTDCFSEVINKYRGFIDVVVVKPDNGIYYGMHQGFELAHGTYVQVLNSDDMFVNGSTYFYTDAIQKDNVDYFAASILLHRGARVLLTPPNHVLAHNIQTNHTTIALKKTVYFSLGGFDFKYKCAADRQLVVKLLLHKCSHRILDKVVAHFRAEGFSSIGRYSDELESLKIQKMGYKFDVIGYLLIFKNILKLSLKNIFILLRLYKK